MWHSTCCFFFLVVLDKQRLCRRQILIKPSITSSPTLSLSRVLSTSSWMELLTDTLTFIWKRGFTAPLNMYLIEERYDNDWRHNGNIYKNKYDRTIRECESMNWSQMRWDEMHGRHLYRRSSTHTMQNSDIWNERWIMWKVTLLLWRTKLRLLNVSHSFRRVVGIFYYFVFLFTIQIFEDAY